MTFKIQTTIKNGFPVIVTGRVCRPEADGGLDRPYIDGLTLTTMRGKTTDFLKLDRDEEADLIDRIWSQLGD